MFLKSRSRGAQGYEADANSVPSVLEMITKMGTKSRLGAAENPISEKRWFLMIFPMDRDLQNH